VPHPGHDLYAGSVAAASEGYRFKTAINETHPMHVIEACTVADAVDTAQSDFNRTQAARL